MSLSKANVYLVVVPGVCSELSGFLSAKGGEASRSVLRRHQSVDCLIDLW